MALLNLALRLLARDIRSGELTLLILALTLAVACSTTVSLFADRLHRTMTMQAAEFLAADMVISGPAKFNRNWFAEAEKLGLSQAQTAEFSSVLIENDEMLLASVKAVSALYPLRGSLKISGSEYSDETVVYKGPEKGTAWIEKRILPALKLKLGDKLTVGEKPVTITRIITYEPDRQGDFYSFSPRVMINEADLQATGIIQPGSHVHYFFQLKGDIKSLLAFKRWVKPQLNPSQRIMDVHEDRPELGSALNRGERYLGLSSIIVVVIAGVAIAMTTRRYSERHFDTTAILRCLGLKQKEMLLLYGAQFIIIGIVSGAIGCITGWFSQQILFRLLSELLPREIANPSLLSIFLGVITGMAILFGFALPPLIRLKQVSALRVLRRELEPLPSSAWLVVSLAVSIIGILIWRYTDDLKMMLTLLIGGSITLLILGLVIYALLALAGKWLPSLSLPLRLGLQGILRNNRASISQILAFSLTFTAMILSFTVRTDLLDTWKKQVPDNAPNHFALNIFPEQLADFQQELKAQKFNSSQVYPVVRGRLVAINHTPVQQVVSKDSQGERATHRELSLTWSQELPEENKIVAGTWWNKPKHGDVSVEQKLAENLKIHVGDKLTFITGSQHFDAVVTSIRALQWEAMKPNFYMIFSPGTLDAFPSTFLTSFYLPQEKKYALNTLVKKFPTISILEVDLILRQIKTILTQLTKAIDYLLYFALLAACTVLFASVYATLDNRILEGAIMRTFGANRSFLRKVQLVEFLLLGIVSGIFAVIISTTLIFGLYHVVIQFNYFPNFHLWILLLPFIAGMLVGAAGLWGVRSVVNQPPIKVLREL